MSDEEDYKELNNLMNDLDRFEEMIERIKDSIEVDGKCVYCKKFIKKENVFCFLIGGPVCSKECYKKYCHDIDKESEKQNSVYEEIWRKIREENK